MKNKKDADLRTDDKAKTPETEDKPLKTDDGVKEPCTPESKCEEQPAESEAKEAEDASVTLSKAEFDEVHRHIEKLQSEKDDTIAFCQRLQADFDNYRKRNATLHLDSVNER